jgi:ubiquinone/menaquinone biosynthesis C-methylase UbiE
VKSKNKIEDKVTEMYNQIPYPEYGDYALTDDYLKKKEYIDLVLGFDELYDQVYKDRKVLEGGCGTGRESMYLAYKGSNLTAIDITDKSLQTAKDQSKKYTFKYEINFQKTSVLSLPFENESFDVVISSGVIHHTKDPKKAFSELSRVLKKDGLIILYVYNNYAHFFSNLRRRIVNLFAGDDIHKRVYIAKKFFPRYTHLQTLATTYDEFGHPHKSEHSIREVLNWFKEHGIEYKSTYPKLGFRGALITKKGWNKFQKGYKENTLYTKHNNPNAIKIFSSEIFQLLYGLKAYSGGYRFVGKKI